MKRIERNIVLPYSPEQIYAIVNNVADYPNFVSWCEEAKVISESHYEMFASITVAKMGIHQTFKTRNRLTEGKRIEMFLLEGPFKILNGIWDFQETEEGGCLVHLEVDFEASNSLLNATMGPLFSGFSQVMFKSLDNRAQALYGA